METKRNKGGAPRKSAALKRDRRVEVRFTEDEYKALDKRRGLTVTGDVATFIRDACLQRPMRMKPITTSQQEVILALVRETRQDLLRVGVNVNQCTRRINSMTDYRDLQRETMSLSDNVKHINDQLDLLITQLSTSQNHGLPSNYGSPDQ